MFSRFLVRLSITFIGRLVFLSCELACSSYFLVHFSFFLIYSLHVLVINLALVIVLQLSSSILWFAFFVYFYVWHTLDRSGLFFQVSLYFQYCSDYICSLSHKSFLFICRFFWKLKINTQTSFSLKLSTVYQCKAR